MISSITIKNFRSLKDVTVDLQDVNLFIGPNNSGKSNFFKALEFLSNIAGSKNRLNRVEDYENYFHNKVLGEPMRFSFKIDGPRTSFYYVFELFPRPNESLGFHEFFGISGSEIESFSFDDPYTINNNFREFIINLHQTPFGYSIKRLSDKFSEPTNNCVVYKNKKGLGQRNEQLLLLQEIGNLNKSTPEFSDNFVSFMLYAAEIVSNILCYSIEPSAIKGYHLLDFDDKINSNASNLIACLDNLRDYHPDIMEELIINLRNCLPEFRNIQFDKRIIQVKEGSWKKDETKALGKQIGLIDKNGVSFWSDELSEGVLYFLALLSIIHQPSPPKLLLLEEPEKGIHPRRIHEVIDYIFQLAEQKGIQVILSTHSTYVVDEFKEIPEAVFIFDKEGAETKIKNLQRDVIDPADKRSKKAKLPKINYTDSLGEHWALGFIGGVPK